MSPFTCEELSSSRINRARDIYVPQGIKPDNLPISAVPKGLTLHDLERSSSSYERL
jgi:hypothetical protein